MKKNCHKSFGFTLIELVVTVGVIGILVAMGVPSFYAYSKHNAPKTSAQDIKNALLEAQSLAHSPAVKDSGYDYYYVTIQLDQDEEANNGNIWLGKGKFTSTGGIDYGGLERQRSLKIDSEAWIIEATPIDDNRPDDESGLKGKSISYYFIIPAGEILFNGWEPNPSFGYSPLCKVEPANCSYSIGESKLKIRSKDVKDSADAQAGDQTIIIDGHGGNVDVVDGLL